jgi:hypothetical protein
MPRGRKPANLNIVPIGVVPGRGRPEPPTNLPKEEQQVWRDIVGVMPSDWFRTSLHLLRLLCHHIATAEALAVALAKARQQHDWDAVRKLTAMHEREARVAGYLSTVLRLTPRSKSSVEWAANQTQTPQPEVTPWDR